MEYEALREPDEDDEIKRKKQKLCSEQDEDSIAEEEQLLSFLNSSVNPRGELPKKGVKSMFKNEASELDLERRRTLLFQSLKFCDNRVQRLKNLCIGEWIDSEKRVQIISPKGKQLKTMGYSKGGKVYLLPEEAM
jgi:hypothetical protein